MNPAGPESIVFVHIFPLFLPNKDGSGILQLGRLAIKGTAQFVRLQLVIGTNALGISPLAVCVWLVIDQNDTHTETDRSFYWHLSLRCT